MKRSKLVRTNLDQRITELVGKTDHQTLAIWACDCAERVLPYFESKYPEDDRPRRAIEAGRAWVRTGVFRMAEVRKAALGAHAAAREVEGDHAARSAARAGGSGACDGARSQPCGCRCRVRGNRCQRWGGSDPRRGGGFARTCLA